MPTALLPSVGHPSGAALVIIAWLASLLWRMVSKSHLEAISQFFSPSPLAET